MLANGEDLECGLNIIGNETKFHPCFSAPSLPLEEQAGFVDSLKTCQSQSQEMDGENAHSIVVKWLPGSLGVQ